MWQTNKVVHVWGKHYRGGQYLTFWKWCCVYKDKDGRLYIRRRNRYDEITKNKEIMETIRDRYC